MRSGRRSSGERRAAPSASPRGPLRALGRGGRQASADRALDQALVHDFKRRYGELDLGPVTVLIACYNEVDNIGRVLEAVPSCVLGRSVRVLVVVDGEDDGTGAVAASHGAAVCVTTVNRGQGAALRLGYELASRHGSKIVATIDGDGQYDPGQLPDLVAPIIEDGLDFVSGSRRLGLDVTGNRLRSLGVVLFAALISVLTGHRVTDPANGFRAMRSEVPLSLDLVEAQYQASELLIGAILQGYRVAERPVVMRPRASGTTRKGTSLRYALNFCRVVLSTWIRER